MRQAVLLVFLAIPCFLDAQDFELADGLKAASATTPGLVEHPMMGAFDDEGRLYLAESTGVNLKKEELLADPPHYIRRIEDTDGDGVFDKSVIFADKLTFPQGALWIYDSLYVMTPPSLWRFQDADGDGIAEIREELTTFFDFTGNAADVHGPFLHPNGRLFWCHGRKGFSLKDNDTGEVLLEGKGARIWSSDISGGEVEAFAGGGMDNPVEVDFTDEGEVVGSVNLFYGRPRGDTLTHWVHGGAYPRFDQGLVVAEFKKTGDLLPPVHNFGHVAVSGMCRYRSGTITPVWKDNWLITHFNTSKITRTRTSRLGSTFAPEETEMIFHLLKPDSHITDVIEDRNGDLLAIDTGGWFRIGCPTSQIAKPDVRGGIYRISSADAPEYRKPAFPNWEKLEIERVAAMLDADEDWLQDRANLELAARGEPAIPELRRILTDEQSSVRARRNSVWTLSRMKFSEAADLIYTALTDPSPSVRQAACNAVGVTRSWHVIAANQPLEREIEIERNRSITGALTGIVRSDEPAIARAAAVALGKMGEFRSIGSLIGRLGRVEDDRMLEHSIIYALIEIDAFEATRNALSSENPVVVSGVLWALDQMDSSKIEVLDILPSLGSENEKLADTAIKIASNHHEWDAALANRFFDWGDNLTNPRKEVLSHLIPAFSDAPPMNDYLTSLIVADDKEIQQFGLELLARSSDLEFQPEWKPVLEANLQPDSDVVARDLTLDALAAVRTGNFKEDLELLAADTSLPRLTRVKAARAMSSEDTVLGSEALALLIEILEAEEDFDTRARAIAILSHSRITSAQRIELTSIADDLGPVEMGAFFDLFPKIENEDQARALADALVASPAFPNLSSTRLEKIFLPYSEHVKQQIADKTASVEEANAAKQERIAEYVSKMDSADSEKGKQAFISAKGSCVVCHRIGEVGGKVGPDLSTIGRIRTATDLFESVLYPSESIARDFETFEVKMKDPAAGSRLGLIETRSAESIELIDPAGQSHTIERTAIDSIRPVHSSLMPMGLENTLTEQELSDMIAYLLSLK